VDLAAAKRALNALLPYIPLGPLCAILDAKNFTITEKGTWPVDFYAPWCPHCRDLDPEWQKLADSESRARFAKVDCEENKAFCKGQAIKHLPTIRLYRGGMRTYEGKKQVDEFKRYLDSQIRLTVRAVDDFEA
jgi:thioredoxin-like negative regulator of GroEL